MAGSNRPFAVFVSDKGGHWDEWLVAASDKESATAFVRAYWGLTNKRLVAYDLTVPEEYARSFGIYCVPKVASKEGPAHFLAVPVASGLKGPALEGALKGAAPDEGYAGEAGRKTSTSSVSGTSRAATPKKTRKPRQTVTRHPAEPAEEAVDDKGLAVTFIEPVVVRRKR